MQNDLESTLNFTYNKVKYNVGVIIFLLLSFDCKKKNFVEKI